MGVQLQRGIVRGLPKHARYLEFAAQSSEHLRPCLQRLPSLVDGKHAVVGRGKDALEALGLLPPGMRRAPLESLGTAELAPMAGGL